LPTSTEKGITSKMKDQPTMFNIDDYYWNVLIQSEAECHLMPAYPAEARMVRIETGYGGVTVWLLDTLDGNIQPFTDPRKLSSAMLEIGGKECWS